MFSLTVGKENISPGSTPYSPSDILQALTQDLSVPVNPVTHLINSCRSCRSGRRRTTCLNNCSSPISNLRHEKISSTHCLSSSILPIGLPSNVALVISGYCVMNGFPKLSLYRFVLHIHPVFEPDLPQLYYDLAFVIAYVDYQYQVHSLKSRHLCCYWITHD